MNIKQRHADAVRMWLWWSMFIVARRRGSDIESSHKLAMRACARLAA